MKLKRGILVLALMGIAYVVAYFVLVKPIAYIGSVGVWNATPDYRGIPEVVFRPMHQLDERYIRPGMWSGLDH